MHIAIDIRNIGKQRTGDEAVFLGLIRALAFVDRSNKYALLIDSRPHDEIERVRERLHIKQNDNFSIEAIGNGNKFLWNAWVLPKYLRTHAIDIYHTQYITPFFVPQRTKIVTHIHDISFKVYPELISFLDRSFLHLLIPRSLRQSAAVIAVSQFTRSEIIREYSIDPDKVQVVHNALSEELASHKSISTEDIQQVKERYKLPEKYILYVGTLQPRKNIPLLIEAFHLLKQTNVPHRLVIVGNKTAHHVDKNIDQALERLGEEEGVIFPGYIADEDLPIIYGGADLFVLPSRYEGFALPLLEAMSQNVPALASDIPVHREVAGNGAAFTPVDNIAQMKELLYDILTHQEKQYALRKAGQERLLRFSWHHSAEKLVGIYSSLNS